MAAVGSAMQAVTIPNSVGQDLANVKKSFIAGTPAGFAGVRSSVKVAAVAKGKCFTAIRAGVQQQAETAPQDVSAVFANMSASVAAPAPPPPSGPVVLGAGAAAAFALVYLADKFSAGSSEETPSGTTKSTPSTYSKSLAPSAVLPRSVTSAAPEALRSMAECFPNAMEDQAFVRACAKELFNLGFSRDNCIALVNTCRDEVCRPLASFIDNEFGMSFNIAGLGGLINCGKTGFGAAFAHSPIFPCDVDGKPRERYVFFAFPHVSVGETGQVGSLLRRGRGKPSSACGALIAINNDAKAGKLVSEDPDDPEYCLLKSKVLGSHACKSCSPDALDLVTVTNGALEVITGDLETLIEKTVNPATADYAVITGVQIHSGNQVPGEAFRVDRTIDYVSPGKMYAVIRGRRFDMQVVSGTGVTVAQSASV